MEYKGIIDRTILVKLTSRERPDKLIKCISGALRLSENPSKINWLICLDENDKLCNNPEFFKTLADTLGQWYINSLTVVGKSENKIHAINRDLKDYSAHNEWHILVNLSDDQICKQKGWDQIIREKMPNDLGSSLWFFDGLQRSINTMEIVGYNYWMRTEHIYHPSYKSFYCDEEATQVAIKLRLLIKDTTVLFFHDHPAGKGNIGLDVLYENNQRYWDEDKMNFNQRRDLNFNV